MKIKLPLFFCCLFLAGLSAAGQEAPPPETDTEETEDMEEFVLPEAEVSARRDSPELVDREKMDRDGAKDLSEAVRYVPGVILSGGGRRNDTAFSVRGFGADSVPVYIDGVPLANPYRGEGDSARLLTGDLESVEVLKGFSSELLGANTIGGAVLLRTAKPANPFEASISSDADLDSVGHYAGMAHTLNLGTRQRNFYLRGVLQYRDVDHYRLPNSFTPGPPSNPQKSGDRLWSDSRDLKLTLMGGWTPRESIDLWLTYSYQWAGKGLSPPAVNTADFSIWDWPVWNRHSVSLNGNFSLGNLSIGALLYFDKYHNRLDEYYRWAAWLAGIHAPHSDYDEYSLGGRLTAGWDFGRWGHVQAALTYKKEDHKSLRGDIIAEDLMSEETHISEDTWSLGTEYAFKPVKPLTLKAGFGFDALNPLEYWNAENDYMQAAGADYFIVQSRPMFLYTWQAGLFYEPWINHEFHLTYARKNHFPSMAHRYSTRFGQTMPNPRLGPEQAYHLELGYGGYFAGLLSINTALYYSTIIGKIVTVSWPNPHYPSASVDLERNLDSTSFWGFEFSPELTLGNRLAAGSSLSIGSYTINHSQTGVDVLPYYPLVTVNGYLTLTLFKTLRISPRLDYIGLRYADTQGAEELAGYFLANLALRYDLGRHFSFSFRIENIFDTWYEIRLHYPLAGRSYNFSLTARY